MRWQIYLLVSWILIVSCSYAVAETVTITANPEWIVANGHDSTIIRAQVSDPILSNYPVYFSVNGGWAQFVLLSLLILLLPVVMILPLEGWGADFGVAENLWQVYELVPALNFSLGFAWLLLAGWLLTRREPPPKMQIA